MIKTIEINTDFNGFVLFDPVILREFMGRPINEDENLFELFMSSELGDAALKSGVLLPILAIDDGGYEINILFNDDLNRPKSDIIFEKKTFPLQVKKKLVIADLVVLRDWSDELGWKDTDIAPGCYAVEISGFRQKDANGNISNCGYDVLFKGVEVIPELTADMGSSNRVMIF